MLYPGFENKIIAKSAYFFPIKEYPQGKNNLIFVDELLG